MKFGWGGCRWLVVFDRLFLDGVVVVVWLRERVVQLLAVAETLIAVLVGFGHVDWSAEQTALLMALVAAVLGVVAHADQRSLRETVDLFRWAEAERAVWVDEVGQPVWGEVVLSDEGDGFGEVFYSDPSDPSDSVGG